MERGRERVIPEEMGRWIASICQEPQPERSHPVPGGPSEAQCPLMPVVVVELGRFTMWFIQCGTPEIAFSWFISSTTMVYG